MATAFISKVDRIDKSFIPHDSDILVGPGSYDDRTGTIKQPLPGFVPFSSSGKRSSIVQAQDTPAPTAYTINRSLLTGHNNASTFHSKSKRFSDIGTKDPNEGGTSGPLPAFAKATKSKKRPQISDKMLDILKATTAPSTTQMVPSIPTKFQSFGYDEMDGKLVPQKPINPGYSGVKGDVVGPLDYDPQLLRSSTGANFGKSAGRKADAKELHTNQMPGPGYYTVLSSFDLLDPAVTAHHDADYVYRLAAAKKKSSATFESKTERNPLQIKTDGPGPLDYHVPSTITAPRPRSPDKQCFTSSGPRFKDDLPKSMRLTVAPGQYNPITSDFEQAKIKILRQKKIASRSGWAQNISFTSTERRFHTLEKPVGPPPGAYTPKTNLADHIAKQNVRAGPFGTTSNRFEYDKDVNMPLREEIAAMELNRDLGFDAHNQAADTRAFKNVRPKFTVNFASKEPRFAKESIPDGPGPAAYDTTPGWTKPTAVKWVPQVGQPKKVHDDKMPGPGDYDLPPAIAKPAPNRRGIMISSSPRKPFDGPDKEGPGPGYYNLQKSLMRPSHNVYLSEPY